MFSFLSITSNEPIRLAAKTNIASNIEVLATIVTTLLPFTASISFTFISLPPAVYQLIHEKSYLKTDRSLRCITSKDITLPVEIFNIPNRHIVPFIRLAW
jgi:hypothetical protein